MIDYLAESVKNPSLLSLVTAYAGGVLASLSPCIYPVIPVVVGVIGASKVERKVQALTLSLSYAAGVALVYTALGVIASLTGSFFGKIATSPISYLVFAAFLFFLALWMADWIRIPLLSPEPGAPARGHLGVFGAGLVSGLIVSPCASPVLFALLLYVSTTKDAALGGAMLLSFSIGMSTILIVIGTFSGAAKTLPRPGPWMVWVKRAMAAGLFAFALYFLFKAGEILL